MTGSSVKVSLLNTAHRNKLWHNTTCILNWAWRNKLWRGQWFSPFIVKLARFSVLLEERPTSSGLVLFHARYWWVCAARYVPPGNVHQHRGLLHMCHLSTWFQGLRGWAAVWRWGFRLCLCRNVLFFVIVYLSTGVYGSPFSIQTCQTLP